MKSLKLKFLQNSSNRKKQKEKEMQGNFWIKGILRNFQMVQRLHQKGKNSNNNPRPGPKGKNMAVMMIRMMKI